MANNNDNQKVKALIKALLNGVDELAEEIKSQKDIINASKNKLQVNLVNIKSMDVLNALVGVHVNSNEANDRKLLIVCRLNYKI